MTGSAEYISKEYCIVVEFAIEFQEHGNDLAILKNKMSHVDMTSRQHLYDSGHTTFMVSLFNFFWNSRSWLRKCNINSFLIIKCTVLRSDTEVK